MDTHNKHFFGTTTIGAKGQVVIPQEARENMGLKQGDHLLVFSMHDGMIALVKLSEVEKIHSHLSEKIKMITEISEKELGGNKK